MPALRPVYLSAPGLLCCAGDNGERFFDAALRGDQSGIVPAPFSVTSGRAFRSGRPFLAGLVPETFLPPATEDGSERIPRLFRIADAALEQIRSDVERVAAAYGPSRVGVCVGSCDNGSERSLKAHEAYAAAGRFPENYELRYQGAAYPAEYIAGRFALTGPVLAVSTACASGAGAIRVGADLIRGDFCDAVVAGGVDVVSKTVLFGFDALEAVSDAPCNPFSKNRKGITLGEGAAFFVLSRDPPGPLGGPGGSPIALLGAGESADAYHITAPHPGGRGAIRAMQEALAAAGIEAGAVEYVNLHGTGTPLNDAMEALAMAAVFPGAAAGPPVSSTKPLTGHTLGAAGALELALCWLALSRSAGNPPGAAGTRLPVHRWDGVSDETLPALRFVSADTVVEGLKVCMSNSFAFGGCNVSLIIGKED